MRPEQIDPLARRLLAAMQAGVCIHNQDGHRWIMVGISDGCPECGQVDLLGDIFKEHGILVNSKIYGSVTEALDVLDEALAMCGEKPLIARFEDAYRSETFHVDILAPAKPGHGRIERRSDIGGIC